MSLQVGGGSGGSGSDDKLLPNLDQNSTKVLNLTLLRRMDPFVEEILITAAHVTFYEFNTDLNEWRRKDVEGSLFVVKRNTQPRFQFIVMNRRNTKNLVEDLLGDFEYDVQIPYLLYRNVAEEVNGIWFYDTHECEAVGNLFGRILNAFSKVPLKSKLSSTRSDFEELESVPSLCLVEAAGEPSTSPAATSMPEDSLVSFSSTSENVGHAEDALIPVQPSPHLPTPSTPSRPLLEIGEPAGKMYEGSPADLVGPSFSTRPSGGSSVPSVAPSLLDPPERGTRRRPLYGGGTALLWPLSAPAPPPSLTSAPGVGPAITRDRVQLALQKLVQNDQFIDLLYRAMLDAAQSP